MIFLFSKFNLLCICFQKTVRRADLSYYINAVMSRQRNVSPKNLSCFSWVHTAQQKKYHIWKHIDVENWPNRTFQKQYFSVFT